VESRKEGLIFESELLKRKRVRALELVARTLEYNSSRVLVKGRAL
jgi:hypothetical protein